MTLPKQTSLFTEDRSTFSQVGSLVSPTQQQESDSARRMIDTSGRKCVEQYGRFNRHGLWARTFSALLIGTGDWFSTRCKLTWKLKGTKYNRMYFQLYPSTLHTEETEFGLLPTPQAMDMMQNPTRQITSSGRIISNQGHNGSAPLKDLAMNGMLPTPKAWDGGGGGARPVNNGKTTFGSPGVKDLAIAGLLPTPRTTGKENYQTRSKRQGHEKAMSYLDSNIQYHLGTTSQLNPRFVLEMMGFPPDWTELPFLSGETNLSKLEGMQ
jgi:hypothetical protein